MKTIQLTINLSDDHALKEIVINYNNTDFESDSKLIRSTCLAILKAIDDQRENMLTQDLLNELNIKREG